MTFFLILNIVSGLLEQLQIFWQLYLKELHSYLIGLLLLELQDFIYPRLLTVSGMLVILTNVNLMEFQVRYSALFHLLSVIYGFALFWMGGFNKNIQLMLEGIFLGPAFFLLYINDLPDDVICSIAIYTDYTTLQSWLLSLYLIYNTLDLCRKWLVDFNTEKFRMFCLNSIIMLVLLM